MPARTALRVALAATLLLSVVSTAWSRDWHFFRPGFERLIAMHCKVGWVMRPERVGPCVDEQRAAMLAWTGAMSRSDAAPEENYLLVVRRNRWSAAPHTDWVRALACAHKALADLRAGRSPE